jgi:hypothetical protein
MNERITQHMYNVFIEIPDISVDSHFEWCHDAVKYLKDNNMNVCIAAGKRRQVIVCLESDAMTHQHRSETILTAFHDGGASRISGAFSIHKKPEYMAHFGKFSTIDTSW